MLQTTKFAYIEKVWVPLMHFVFVPYTTKCVGELARWYSTVQIAFSAAVDRVNLQFSLAFGAAFDRVNLQYILSVGIGGCV